MSENIELDASALYPKYREFIDASSTKEARAPFYALIECLQNRLDNMGVVDEEKGAMLADLFHHLRENNKVAIALFNDAKRNWHENKPATMH